MQAEHRLKLSFRRERARSSRAQAHHLDVAFLGLLGLMVAGHVAPLSSRWAGSPPLSSTRSRSSISSLCGPTMWRPLVGRLMLLGLVAGVLELFTDAAGHQFARSLYIRRTGRCSGTRRSTCRSRG